MNESETAKLLASNKLMLEDASELSDELLR
jgi:hypothetical protein